jgi:hypothetical protein
MQAGIRTWTTGTKSLRYGLFTMDLRMSWDVRQSVEVQFDGRCDGVVDVGYGCQSGADSANNREVTVGGEQKRLSRGVRGPVP